MRKKLIVMGVGGIAGATLKALSELSDKCDVDVVVVVDGDNPIKPDSSDVVALTSLKVREVDEKLYILKDFPITTKKQQKYFAKQQIKKGWKRR